MTFSSRWVAPSRSWRDRRYRLGAQERRRAATSARATGSVPASGKRSGHRERSGRRERSAASAVSVLAEPQAGSAPFIRLIDGARTSIELTMYELFDPQVEQALAGAAHRGVDVRVLLNGGYYSRHEATNATAYRVSGQPWRPRALLAHLLRPDPPEDAHRRRARVGDHDAQLRRALLIHARLRGSGQPAPGRGRDRGGVRRRLRRAPRHGVGGHGRPRLVPRRGGDRAQLARRRDALDRPGERGDGLRARRAPRSAPRRRGASRCGW